MDCIFCKLANKEIPTNVVFEDEIVTVFLDASPVTNGHSLIVPKKHYTCIEDIDIDTLKHIQKVAKDLYPVYKEKLKCDGLTLTQNNGYGQEVKHYHLHLIPRYQNDGIEFIKQTNLLEISEVLELLK